MRKLKKIKAEGIYLLQGKASADSTFMENKNEAKQFLIFANYFLKGYLKVYEYTICNDGWQMLVKINSEDKIRFHLGCANESRIEELEVWRLISEQIRKLISQYVLFVNRKRGRSGSLVHSSYERFLFESVNEGKLQIELIREQLVVLYQKNKKYRGKVTHYAISKKLGKGCILLCSKSCRKDRRVVSYLSEVLSPAALRVSVLSEMIINTKNIHKIHKNLNQLKISP